MAGRAHADEVRDLMTDLPSTGQGHPLVLRNEFAHVSVTLHDPGGRPRLRVEDLRTQQVIELDPIELESLAWARHEDLSPLLDPSLTRWANRGD